MKKFLLPLGILSVWMLSACTNTLNGLKADTRDTKAWAHYQPSAMEKMVGPAPVGYKRRPGTEETLPSVVIPTGPSAAYPLYVQQAPTTTSPGGLVWHNIGYYDARRPSLPSQGGNASPARYTRASAPASVKYNDSVNVYPVDGDLEPYSRLDTDGGSPRGEMVQQIFFPYGSAKVSKVERSNLRELAQSLTHTRDSYGINVVGHASKRVDHVRDPVQKKMINFEMAQKRADAVVNELRDAGANPNWVMATSRGDKEPNPRRRDKTQEAADRRAEVYMDVR